DSLHSAQPACAHAASRLEVTVTRAWKSLGAPVPPRKAGWVVWLGEATTMSPLQGRERSRDAPDGPDGRCRNTRASARARGRTGSRRSAISTHGGADLSFQNDGRSAAGAAVNTDTSRDVRPRGETRPLIESNAQALLR